MTYIGLESDLNIARRAYRTAREGLAHTWRYRRVPVNGWASRYLQRDYEFWRHVYLLRVQKCRVAVEQTRAALRDARAA